MSIFGLQHGIFNDIQVFNKDLNTSLGTSNPTIWHMLGKNNFFTLYLNNYNHFFFRMHNKCGDKNFCKIK